MRTTCFVATTLPLTNISCRLTYSFDIGDVGGCGDMLFSGHAIIIAAAWCIIWEQRYLPIVVKVALTLAGLHTGFISALERFHYTADILLGFYITPLVYYSLGKFFQVNRSDALKPSLASMPSTNGPKYMVGLVIGSTFLGWGAIGGGVGALAGIWLFVIPVLTIHVSAWSLGRKSPVRYLFRGTLLDFDNFERDSLLMLTKQDDDLREDSNEEEEENEMNGGTNDFEATKTLL
jgi:hypothetical protein